MIEGLLMVKKDTKVDPDRSNHISSTTKFICYQPDDIPLFKNPPHMASTVRFKAYQE